MGTTTFYLRYNDFGARLKNMKIKDREKFDELSPYKQENSAFGWRVPLELHNGNIYTLVFWKGKLMKLEEWTLLKKYIENQLAYLDKDFKKELRKLKSRKMLES